jgi:hypothetical protein
MAIPGPRESAPRRPCRSPASTSIPTSTRQHAQSTALDTTLRQSPTEHAQQKLPLRHLPIGGSEVAEALTIATPDCCAVGVGLWRKGYVSAFRIANTPANTRVMPHMGKCRLGATVSSIWGVGKGVGDAGTTKNSRRRRLFLLLWLSLPSVFLVMLEKPNRSSFTFTFMVAENCRLHRARDRL